jgi:hypothetical protein
MIRCCITSRCATSTRRPAPSAPHAASSRPCTNDRVKVVARLQVVDFPAKMPQQQIDRLARQPQLLEELGGLDVERAAAVDRLRRRFRFARAALRQMEHASFGWSLMSARRTLHLCEQIAHTLIQKPFNNVVGVVVIVGVVMFDVSAELLSPKNSELSLPSSLPLPQSPKSSKRFENDSASGSCQRGFRGRGGPRPWVASWLPLSTNTCLSVHRQRVAERRQDGEIELDRGTESQDARDVVPEAGVVERAQEIG